MMKLNFSIHEWEKEKMDELVRLESKRIDHKEGVEQGIEQGIERGIEEEKINTIKNMLKKNIKLNLISEITGKSIEEIQKIKKEQF